MAASQARQLTHIHEMTISYYSTNVIVEKQRDINILIEIDSLHPLHKLACFHSLVNIPHVMYQTFKMNISYASKAKHRSI